MKRDLDAALAVALSSPSLWDEGVEAARNACVARAPLASAAIAAAAFYDNPLTGVRALRRLMRCLSGVSVDGDAWLAVLRPAPHPETDDTDFVPGFGYVSEQRGAAVFDACRVLHRAVGGERLGFYLRSAHVLRPTAGRLNATGMCGLAFLDAGLSEDEAELRFLMLRLEPALAAAQRARRTGLSNFPFFEDGYAYEGAWPSPNVSEPCSDGELAALKKAVGIDE